MSSAHRALFTALSPIPAGLVADFAAPCICEQILCCPKHAFQGASFEEFSYEQRKAFYCKECRESESSEPTDTRYVVRPLCYHLMVMKLPFGSGCLLAKDCVFCPDQMNHTCGLSNNNDSRCKNMRALYHTEFHSGGPRDRLHPPDHIKDDK